VNATDGFVGVTMPGLNGLVGGSREADGDLGGGDIGGCGGVAVGGWGVVGGGDFGGVGSGAACAGDGGGRGSGGGADDGGAGGNGGGKTGAGGCVGSIGCSGGISSARTNRPTAGNSRLSALFGVWNRPSSSDRSLMVMIGDGDFDGGDWLDTNTSPRWFRINTIGGLAPTVGCSRVGVGVRLPVPMIVSHQNGVDFGGAGADSMLLTRSLTEPPDDAIFSSVVGVGIPRTATVYPLAAGTQLTGWLPASKI
jgi:hypothetical protein